MKLTDLAAIMEIKTNNSIIEFFRKSIPAIDERLDSGALADFIAMTYGDCTPRYNTVESFINASNIWFRVHKRQIKHMLDALDTDYKPFEEFNTQSQRDDDSKRDINDHTVSSGTTDSNGTQEHTVSADNEPNYQPRDKDISTNHDGTVSESDNERGDKYVNKTTTKASGHNASNQTLALEEWEVAQLNIYETIGNMWSNDLCILVW